MSKKTQSMKEDAQLIFRAVGMLKYFLGKGYLTLKCIMSTIRIVTPYIYIYMTGRIITALTQNEPFEALIKYVLIAAGSTLFFDIVMRTINRKCLIMLNSCWYKHEAMFSRKALSLDYGKAESAEVLGLRAKIAEAKRSNGSGIMWVAEALSTIVSTFVAIVIAFVMLTGMFVSRSSATLTGILKLADSPFLAVLLALFCVSLIALSVKSNIKKEKLTFAARGESAKINPILDYYSEKFLNENESGKDIRIFNEKSIINEEIRERVLIPAENIHKKIFKVTALYGGISAGVSALLGGAVYIFVGLKALAGAFGAGKVVEYYGLITKLIENISKLAAELGYLKSNNFYLKQELEYLDLTSDMENGTKTLDDIDIQNAEFEFHNVSFRYPSTETYVLKNLSLKIRAGERLAVVGMNGSGKSTMIKLLCRLYDPTEGYITVNGIDLKEFDYTEYLKLFAIVFQDFKLLAFPVGENVAASESYDEEKVWKCLEMAGIKERVEEFPQKLNQAIYKLYEKDGIDLSGGEEQKVAIARALYKDAPFVILDEPTAALDPIAESEIYSKFDEIVGNKTAFYISHRLSSCRFCDRIMVFDGGTLSEEGSHDELLANSDGKYAELWNAQAQYYTKSEA